MSAAKILLVEDEVLVRELLALELTEAGYHVLEAADGDEALAHLAAGHDLTLLLTDIRLPGAHDGWAVAAAARANRPDLPVIYITGYSEREVQPVPGGILFRKPFRAADIVAAVRAFGLLPAQ